MSNCWRSIGSDVGSFSYQQFQFLVNFLIRKTSKRYNNLVFLRNLKATVFEQISIYGIINYESIIGGVWLIQYDIFKFDITELLLSSNHTKLIYHCDRVDKTNLCGNLKTWKSKRLQNYLIFQFLLLLQFVIIVGSTYIYNGILVEILILKILNPQSVS